MNIFSVSLLTLSLFLTSCTGFDFFKKKEANFVKIKDGKFSLNDKTYTFLGTNLWYGMSLGAKDSGGDRARLVRELDQLSKMGVKNLRIMASSEGPSTAEWRISPPLQEKIGSYSKAQFEGLDFLLSEMAKRNMKAVVCLNNFWQWSGGFAAYVSSFGPDKKIPYPKGDKGWGEFERYVASFYTIDTAKQAYYSLLEKLIERKNSITGKLYKDDPTIMSWQLANEPRGSKYKEAYVSWVKESSELIKSLDKNHLVTIGSEGVTPHSGANNEFERVHSLSTIDYATFHIWVQNWQWYNPENGEKSLDKALVKAKDYFDYHVDVMNKISKPVVMEEFGISRDKGSYSLAAESSIRDKYYSHVFSWVQKEISKNSSMSGVNFWAWSGEGRPREEGGIWKAGDDYIGDPPHEPQGWYGVYNNDASTIAIIKDYSKKINRL